MTAPVLPVPFTEDEQATQALIEELRAIVLARMTPPGVVPDRLSVHAIEEHLNDALVWVDVVMLRQAELVADGEITAVTEVGADSVELTR
jgi:hypothetical protein